MTPLQLEERIANDFKYHAPPHKVVGDLHDRVRTNLGNQAQELADMLPRGRELETALSKLEEAMFWANAAIARNHEFILHRAGVPSGE